MFACHDPIIPGTSTTPAPSPQQPKTSDSNFVFEGELESDVFGCCGEGAGVVEVPGIIGSWHANITKTISRLF
jgi:hypothetical protein